MDGDFIVVIIELCNGLDFICTTDAKTHEEAEHKVSKRYMEANNMPEQRFKEKFQCQAIRQKHIIGI